MFCEKSSAAIVQQFKLKRDLVYFLNQNNFLKTIDEEIYKFANLCKDTRQYTTIVIPIQIDFRIANDFSSKFDDGKCITVLYLI